jgi:hypothetical protein
MKTKDNTITIRYSISENKIILTLAIEIDMDTFKWLVKEEFLPYGNGVWKARYTKELWEKVHKYFHLVTKITDDIIKEQQEQVAEIEFDFESNIRKVIENNYVIFNSFCIRHKYSHNIGLKIRQILDEYEKKNQSLSPQCPGCETVTDLSRMRICKTCQAGIDFSKGIGKIIKGKL